MQVGDIIVARDDTDEGFKEGQKELSEDKNKRK